MEREPTTGEPTTDDPDGWRRVYAWAVKRATVRRWNMTRLYKETLSEGTYRKMLKGREVKYDFNRLKVTDGLGWTEDSIDRILAGLEPLVKGEVNLPDGNNATNEDLDREEAELMRRWHVLREIRGSSPPPQPED